MAPFSFCFKVSLDFLNRETVTPTSPTFTKTFNNLSPHSPDNKKGQGSTMSQDKLIVFQPEKCTACRYCEIACSHFHHGTTDFKKSNIFVSVDLESGAIGIANCQHCDEPFCLAACPVDAISKDEQTGLVSINSMRCIGCKSCVLACPLKVVWFDERHKIAQKCDFCDGEPLCVAFCSPGALKLVDREEAEEFVRHECLDDTKAAIGGGEA